MPAKFPLMPFIGLGPGQFSSRAALMGTGLYFGGVFNSHPLPLLPQAASGALQDYLLDLWVEEASNKYYGSTQKAYFSWLSVYSEMGGLTIAAVVITLLLLLRRIELRSRGNAQDLRCTAVAAGIIFLALIGIQENYWEVPQAILVGCILLKAMYANVVYSVRFPIGSI
jgi:hypothetical protein